MVEVDAAVILQMQQTINNLRDRLDGLEQFQNFHQGIDIGLAGMQYPHPFLKLISAEFGTNSSGTGASGRIDKFGMQIISVVSQLGAIYFVPSFLIDPSAAAAQATLQGFSNNESIGLFSRNAAQTLSAQAYTVPGGFQAQANDLNALTQTGLLVGLGRIDMSSVSTYISALRIPTSTSDPVSLLNGDEWYRTDTNVFQGRRNGATLAFLMAGDALAATRGNWKVFYSDGSGVFTELALGASGTVLTSNGASAAPSFASAGGGVAYETNPLVGQTNTGGVAAPILGIGTPGVLIWVNQNSAVLGNSTNLTEATFGTWTARYDATAKRWYIDNTTGTVCRKHFALIGGIDPNGYLGGALPAFDSDTSALTGVPPTGLDTFVYEFQFRIVTARASDTTRGIGYSNDMTTGWGAAQFGIAMYRKSGGSGWTIKSTDGTTSSDTSESSDTSDGATHIGRLEWHAKATPEVRLYIDGVLKVTKTTNLPALGGTTLIKQIGVSVATGDATSDLFYYSGLYYWKNSP